MASQWRKFNPAWILRSTTLEFGDAAMQSESVQWFVPPLLDVLLDEMSVTDGPFVEVKEVVGGLWIVVADDLDGAQALMHDCPHLEFGSLEIREIEFFEQG